MKPVNLIPAKHLVARGRRLRARAWGVGLCFYAAALVVAITQSYLFSVGNIGTATAWICLFLVARQPEPATSSERIASKSPAMLA